VRGVRWVFWVSLITLPMSFLTNLVLGRRSVEALGMYGAIQILLGGFQTFLIFGGNAVFTRFVPRMSRDRRFSFLVSYAGLVLSFFTAAWLLARLVAPAATDGLLARFGAPPPAMAYLLGVAVVIWAFGSHFLYGVERAREAVFALKLAVPGYFIFTLLVLTPIGQDWLAQPTKPLWWATCAAYGASALVAASFVFALPSDTMERRWGWFLPAGFWSVVCYTHLGTVVEFVYSSLAPSVVLLWLDVASLGRLTAALRWITLISLLPGMLVSVVIPGLAKLDAAGLRADALSQLRASIRAAELAVVPCVLALILLAPELMGVFGPDYRDFAGILRIAALSSLAGPVVYLGTGLAVAFGRMRAYLIVSVLYVAASLSLSLVLVPALGLTGAAIAIAVSSAIQAFAMLLMARRWGLRPPRTSVIGWSFGLLTLAIAELLTPPWPFAAAMWVLLCAAFAWSAGMTVSEAGRLVGRALGRAS
jgi:O-antigen/teichoic acid export membrane protein